MTERVPIIAGNWKMNKTSTEARAYVSELQGLVAGETGVEIVLCPPYTSLAEVSSMVAGGQLRVAAQSMHYEPSGAYTGEISAAMLTDIGVTDVILGHSERREFFCENDADLARKTSAALAADLRPILCVGETDAEREAGQTEEKVKRQVSIDLETIAADRLPEIVIAYEPIWAIGTGKTATPEIAQEACRFIRETLAANFNSEAAERTRILYGGSVKPDNISDLMIQKDIDGALVGGACLNAGDFARIIRYH